jgi:hypothetical protein
MIIPLQKTFIAMAVWPSKIATWPIIITHGLDRTRRNLLILIVLVAFALITANPLAAQEPEKLTLSPAGSASWDDHLNFQQANPEFGKEPKVIPFMPRPAPQEVGDAINPPGPVTPSAPEPAIGAGKSLIPATSDFQALPDNDTTIPPDTMGAAGPNHLMTMLNSQVRIQDKTGTDLGTVTLDTWWTFGTGLSGDPFDPRIIYDSLSGRWMAVVDANRSTATSRTWFAVSNTDDPTGIWYYYTINMESPNSNSLWHDYPDLGTNRHWIALTNNMFDASGFFQGLGLIVIDKTTLPPAPILSGWVFNQGFDSWGGRSGFTLRPALTFDPLEEVLYMVDGNYWASYPGGGPATGLIRLSQITGAPPAVPVCSFVPDGSGPVPGTGQFWTTEDYDPWYQINAHQLGTTTRVRTNDSRILNAVYRNGRLWFTHSAGRPNNGDYGVGLNRTVVSWYEVNPLLLNTQPNPVLQSGTLDPGVDGHYFFPSITANRNNDAALGFSRSDPSTYVAAAATGRQSGDPTGTMDPITVIKPGEDSYVKDFGSGRVRWGDYSATVVDPVDDTTFWTIQEYAAMDVGPNEWNDRWGTWWAKLSYGGDSLGLAEIIGTWDDGIRYWDFVASAWTQMTPYATDGDIAAGDFTGDGKADVASSWEDDGLWYQDGATLVWTKIDDLPAHSVTAGDVTGDGRFEIIGTWDNGIWYWDLAASTWTRMTPYATDGDIAAGDFTGDGKADVASIWSDGLWYQDGDTLAWEKVSDSAPDRVTAGDVTGD